MKKILTVDDSTFTRNFIKATLHSESYSIIEAINGKEAIEIYKKEKPDLVLIDILMPEMDGITACEKIREFDPKSKIIICTTDKQEYRKKKAKEIGVVDFIVKPFDDNLKLSIKKALEQGDNNK
ncbi:MAG: response regulator [Desulfobacterales bacterium]|nr:response regulator [Desulfobacterales bacterium]